MHQLFCYMLSNRVKQTEIVLILYTDFLLKVFMSYGLLFIPTAGNIESVGSSCPKHVGKAEMPLRQ